MSHHTLHVTNVTINRESTIDSTCDIQTSKDIQTVKIIHTILTIQNIKTIQTIHTFFGGNVITPEPQWNCTETHNALHQTCHVTICRKSTFDPTFGKDINYGLQCNCNSDNPL